MATLITQCFAVNVQIQHNIRFSCLIYLNSFAFSNHVESWSGQCTEFQYLYKYKWVCVVFVIVLAHSYLWFTCNNILHCVSCGLYYTCKVSFQWSKLYEILRKISKWCKWNLCFLYHEFVLTYWGHVTHICVSKLAILVQILACRLAGAKPLSESMLEYC